ncbi:MAG: hypothetical protein R3Y23_01920 [Bacillota bacterium]
MTNRSSKNVTKFTGIMILITLILLCVVGLSVSTLTAYAEDEVVSISNEYTIEFTYADESTDLFTMATDDSIVYTYTIISGGGSFYITDGESNWDNSGENYTVDAGTYIVTFAPNEQSDVVTTTAVNYYMIGEYNDFEMNEESIMATENGIDYTLTSYSEDSITVYFKRSADASGAVSSTESYKLPNGTTEITYTPSTGLVTMAQDKEYAIEFTYVDKSTDSFTMTTDDNIVYTYTIVSGGGEFSIKDTDTAETFDDDGENFTVGAGTYIVTFTPNAESDTVVITEVNYYVVGLLSENVQMATTDGLTYAYTVSTEGGSYYITNDVTDTWDNEDENYTIGAGSHTIYFTLNGDGTAEVESLETKYYMVGEYNMLKMDADSILTTENGVAYTYYYTGAEITVYFAGSADASSVTSITNSYVIEAGTTAITYMPSTGEVVQTVTQYYLATAEETFIATDDNRLVTVDGVNYTIEYTTIKTANFYIVDLDNNVWDNSGEYYVVESGTSLVTFVPTAEEAELVTVEYLYDLDDEIKYTTIKITSAEEFVAFAAECQNDSYSENLIVYLTTDIDLTDYTGYQIPIFCGYFDGTYHTISGITIESEGTDMALFRYLTVDATIMRLTVEVDVQPEGAKESVGGLVGNNSGLVEDCEVYGYVAATSAVGGVVGTNEEGGIVSNCVNYAVVDGLYQVGGIVGQNSGSIINCVNYGSINNEDKDLNSIVIYNGGIVGYNVGYVYGSENKGIVGNEKIGSYCGGVAGANFGTVAYSGNSGTVYGETYVGGVIGNHGTISADVNAELIAAFTETLENMFGVSADEVPELDAEPVADTVASYLYNTGIVTGTSQVGGIAGAIFGDGTTYSLSSSYNAGTVTGTSTDIGGIVGRLAGTVSEAVNVGNVYGGASVNVGGIVGNTSSGTIQYSASFGVITGAGFVGGIAGYGYDVANCYSYSMIMATGENLGSIAGYIAGTATYNYFVPTNDGNYGGIDGINYSGKAESITIDELQSQYTLNEALVGFSADYWIVSEEKVSYPQLASFFATSEYEAVDALFQEVMALYGGDSFSVEFMANGELVERIWVAYNGTLTLAEMPEIPVVDGYYGSWNMTEISNLTDNLIVEAEYVKALTTISSGGTNAVVLAEGVFHPDTQVVLTALTIALPSELADNYTTYGAYKIELTLYGEVLSLEGVTFKLYVGNVTDTVIASNASASVIDTTENGNYIVFTLSDTDTIILMQEIPVNVLLENIWYIVGGFVAMAIIIVLIIIILRKRKQLDRAEAIKNNEVEAEPVEEIAVETSIPQDATDSEVTPNIIIPTEPAMPTGLDRIMGERQSHPEVEHTEEENSTTESENKESK